jgi:hypothetical protein
MIDCESASNTGMSYEGRPSTKAIEQEFPHGVVVPVPNNGFAIGSFQCTTGTASLALRASKAKDRGKETVTADQSR